MTASGYRFKLGFFASYVGSTRPCLGADLQLPVLLSAVAPGIPVGSNASSVITSVAAVAPVSVDIGRMTDVSPVGELPSDRMVAVPAVTASTATETTITAVARRDKRGYDSEDDNCNLRTRRKEAAF